MGRAERALQRIYEDPGWREDLYDSEAEALIKWAENRLFGWDTAAADDADFEVHVDLLRDLLNQLNRLIGRRAALTLEQQQTMLDRMADEMHVTSIEPGVLDTATGLSAQGAPDNLRLIGALTTWLDGGELPTAPVDDGRADTGVEPPPAAPFSELRAQMSGIAAPIASEEEPPPSPPPPADPAAMSAILGFFNTAPTESEQPPSSSSEESHADTP